mmetsp:Transcript_16670/g.52113  ORF Transcript_16670/g.52113 Transcript_16670/m.52113 type:complete len:213 (+) Transcript_16670:51-689(+)
MCTRSMTKTGKVHRGAAEGGGVHVGGGIVIDTDHVHVLAHAPLFLLLLLDILCCGCAGASPAPLASSAPLSVTTALTTGATVSAGNPQSAAVTSSLVHPAPFFFFPRATTQRTRSAKSSSATSPASAKGGNDAIMLGRVTWSRKSEDERRGSVAAALALSLVASWYHRRQSDTTATHVPPTSEPIDRLPSVTLAAKSSSCACNARVEASTRC